MKKIILLAIFILSANIFATEKNDYTNNKGNKNIYLKFGVGTHNILSGSYDSFGFVEYAKYFSEKTELGIGIGYQYRHENDLYFWSQKSSSGINESVSASFSFDSIPIYLSYKYSIINNKNSSFRFLFDLGYSFNTNLSASGHYGSYNSGYDYGNFNENSFKTSGGIYIGTGFESQFKNFNFSFTYAFNRGEINYKPLNIVVIADYLSLNFFLGYRFNL
ncbi:MAG: hypothetical protein ACRCSK_03460 [Fusobacteriaceae bacterium]